MAFAICRRSADRGRGADAGAAPFPVAKIVGISSHVKDTSAPVVHGPAWLIRYIVVSAVLLAREIESGSALARVVGIDPSRKEVSWQTPESKSDCAAPGAVRRHTCACGSMPGAPRLLPSDMCPACALADHVKWIRNQFPDLWASSKRHFSPPPPGVGDKSQRYRHYHSRDQVDGRPGMYRMRGP